MDDRVVLERCASRGGEIQLARRYLVDPVFEIVSNGTFLMSSERTGSEVALADLALAAARETAPGGLRLLVGGLGLGLTLRAALRDPRVREAVVVELEESVVRWNRTHLAELNGGALADPRVRVVEEDLVVFLRNGTDRFDAVLVDIDNGPDWLVEPSNAALYDANGIEAIRRRTSEGGVAAMWTADPCPPLLEALALAFEEVREERITTVGRNGRSFENAVSIALRPRPSVAAAGSSLV